MEAQKAVKCPECGSSKLFKDGLRPLKDGSTKQRFLCRVCGYRFTDPSIKSNITGQVRESLNPELDNLEVGIISRDFSVKEVFDSSSFAIGKDVSSHKFATVEKGLNALPFYNSNRQICALEKKAKNLEPTQKDKFCAEDVKLTADIQGLIAQFYSYLEKNAYSEATEYPKKIKRLAKLGANLYDPENVKEIIAKLTFRDQRTGEIKKAKNGTKNFYCCAYDAFAKMSKIQWENPGYKQEEKEVYFPYETEIDALINAANSRRMATFLQTLKETYADPSEALRIRWIDIDEKNSTIKINFPVKGHNSGTMPVSAKLLSMISALPHKSEKVFPSSYHSIYIAYNKLRKRVSAIQQNPRILAVEFRGFRHWGGTKIAFETNGNTLEVKKQLRHKSIESTMKYIGKIDFKTDDFETTSTTTLEDILRLGSSGWIEYSIAHINGQEIHCFKKPKRFMSHA